MITKQFTKLIFLVVIFILPTAVVRADNDRRISVRKQDNGSAERRVALIIGNGKYADAPLRNPVNDADTMERTLRETGFEVIVRKNASRKEMFSAIKEFGQKLQKSDVGLFYYAGHGVQVDRANYLLPVDLVAGELKDADDLRRDALPLNEIMDKMRNAGTRNIVILDACRDNPFLVGSRGGPRGLAQISTPAETTILYATDPGTTASDSSGGDNGAFTRRLVEFLGKDGVELVDVMREVSLSVSRDTGGAQKPVFDGVMNVKFYFHSPRKVLTAEETSTVVTADPGLRELRMWEGAQKANSPMAYREYLKRYPNGEYAGMANIIMTSLESPVPHSISVPLPQSTPVLATVPSQLQAFTDPTTGMKFVPVKGGCFQMGDTFGDGDADEKPVHEACVSDFAIGKYEVTQGEWKKVMGSNPSENTSWLTNTDNYPVERVSWDDIQKYISKLNSQSGKQYRLPTEAEWEYAARSGGKSEMYSGGNDVDNVAWHFSNSGREIHPVGQRQANGLGIYDMSGNVWEWTGDYWFAAYSSDRQQNPTGPSTGSDRVRRGGFWDNTSRFVRASLRSVIHPDARYNDLGFRLVSPVR